MHFILLYFYSSCIINKLLYVYYKRAFVLFHSSGSFLLTKVVLVHRTNDRTNLENVYRKTIVQNSEIQYNEFDRSQVESSSSIQCTVQYK